MQQKITMDHRVSAFAQRVYQLCREIPVGRITTYGEMAKALNTSARAVGQALRRNPYAPEVPCHRVVAADGCLGGFMGHREGEAIQSKIDRLSGEGVEVRAGVVRDFSIRLHRFPDT